MIRLKNGQVSIDPRLDRVPTVDPRNRDFPVLARLTTEQQARPRSYTWRVYLGLDQGNEGACVGFAWTHEAIARPVPVPSLNNDTARKLYHEAQDLDEWPGHDYEGSSTLGGAKAAQARGWISSYHWAFTVEELALAVGYKGPAVIGIDWLEQMFHPDDEGFIHLGGTVAGGHDILVYRVDVKRQFFGLWQSWGPGWGQPDPWGYGGSTCKVSFADMRTLLENRNGDACIPEGRRMPRA